MFLCGIVTLALIALPYAAGDRPLGLDRWLSFAMLAVVGWLAFAIRIVVLIGNGAFQFSRTGPGLHQRPRPVGDGRRPRHAGSGGLHDVARVGLPVTAGIERLEGVWTIVPTPFQPDGALDIGQPADPHPVHRGSGRGRHDDPGRARRGRPAGRRRARRGHRRGPRRGRRPAGLRRREPRRHGPGGRLRPPGRGGRGPLGDARAAGPGPAQRRGRASPTTGRWPTPSRSRSSSRTTRPAAA